jgi:hypothetical protein
MPFGLIAAVNAMTSAGSTEANNNRPVSPVHISHLNAETVRACLRMCDTD